MPSDRRLALAAAVLALLGLVLAGRYLRTSAPASASGPAPVSASPAPLVSEPIAGPVVVDVVGAVRHGGVYRLPAGSRVRDALRAAGGARDGAHTVALNLAERLADGEQIVVPGRGLAVAGSSAAGPAGAGAPAAIVHLNSATVEQLDGLDGIGPTLAARIVAWRQAHGGFRSTADLGNVPGIGPGRLAALHGKVAP
jgi:competence protein ComEA